MQYMHSLNMADMHMHEARARTDGRRLARTLERVRGAGTGLEPSLGYTVAADPCNGFQPG